MPNEAATLISRLYAKVHLNEGMSRLYRFFEQAYLRSGLSVKDMARLLFLPIPVTSAIKNECKKQGLVSVTSGGIRLTETGTEFVRKHLHYEAVNRDLLLRVLEAPDLPVSLFEHMLPKLEEIYRERPSADVTLDQSLCTAETGLKRALLMLRLGGLMGRRIFFAGDDDLTTVAVRLLIQALSHENDPEAVSLTVFDIDERTLHYIGQVSGHIRAPIERVLHDLRRPIPEGYTASFDAVFTDPPYTLPGLTLFLSRGVQALKNEPDLCLYLSCARKDPQTRLSVQRMLCDAGLVVHQIHEHFNQYHGAQILGGVSDLTVLTTTLETQPLISCPMDEPFYTNEARRSTRVYRCKKCRAEYRVGYGQPIETIERLKNETCAQCGGTVFLLHERHMQNGGSV